MPDALREHVVWCNPTAIEQWIQGRGGEGRREFWGGVFPQEAILDCSLKDGGKFARQIWGGVAGGERNGIPRGRKSTRKGRDGCFFAT